MDIIEALEKHGIKITLTDKDPAYRTCYGCLFRGEYRDMGASTPICEREDNFVDAITKNNASGKCPWYITRKQVRELQDAFMKGD